MALDRRCPVCNQQAVKALFRPKASLGWVVKCLNCNMVYISAIENTYGLILEGPTNYPLDDPRVLTSSNLADVRDSWELRQLPKYEQESYPSPPSKKLSIHWENQADGTAIFE